MMLFCERITTPNLILRVPNTGDGQLVYEGVIETIDELKQWPNSWFWPHKPQSPELSEKYCLKAFHSFQNNRKWHLIIIDKLTEQFVGSIEFHTFDHEHKIWQLGFWTRKSFQRKGLMQEALFYMITWMNITYPEVIVMMKVETTNIKSLNLMEKLGFILIDEFDVTNNSGVRLKVYSNKKVVYA